SNGRGMSGVGIPFEPLQVTANIGRALIAQIAILLQSLRDNSLEVRRNLRVNAGDRGRVAIENCIEDDAGRVAGIRLTSRCHFLEQQPEGEDVTASIESFTANLLG